jgi:hypothetical protein
MNALVMTCQRRHPSPELLIVGLFLAGAGCLAVAVVQLLTTPGPALLAVAVTGGLARLWRVAPVVAVPLPVVGCLGAACVVSPWLLLGGLAWLALRTGGAR